jgi:hypothetical protein
VKANLTVIKIDPEDNHLLVRYSWFVNNRGYLYSPLKKQTLLLHRLVMGLGSGRKVQVDHINGDKLDNRRANLRLCDNRQNHQNTSKPVTNTSGFKGVHSHPMSKKWVAAISINSKLTHLGMFETKELAAKAYDDAARKFYGEFARLNFNDKKT